MTDETDRINTLERLPRRRHARRDLWPGIESRLKPRRSRYAFGQLALAASLVAGLASVVSLTLRGPATPGAMPATVALQASSQKLTTDSRAIVEANLSLLRGAERQLQQALKQNPDSTTLRSLLANAEDRRRALRAML